MTFFKPRKINGNFDLYQSYPYYTPGIAGMLGLLLWLLAGALLGNLLTLVLSMTSGAEFVAEYGMFISYPVMFIPAMIFASYQSKRNALFDTGYSLNSSHFGKSGGFAAALMAMVLTVSVGYMTDAVNTLLPAMPDWLEKMLDSMTRGNLWVNFVCVSIFAPIFEEWLCRGEVLRGLLNHKNSEGKTMSPAIAIAISALFFAIIHANPWQAIPAFFLGCAFGYVYYKTGSLWLTMLMHFTNNTLALVLSNIDSLKDFDNWKQILGTTTYWIVFLVLGLAVVFLLKAFRDIPLNAPHGNCDVIKTSGEEGPSL